MDLCGPITGRQVVEFDYDGHPRVVQPTAHDPHKTTGNHVLRGYQVAGTGNTRSVPFWDLFLVEKISGLTVTGQVFTADPPGYSKGDKHINVHCEL